MSRLTFTTALAALLVLPVLLLVKTASAGPLIPQDEAARHGLRRAWFAQVQMDSGRARVTHLRLFEGSGRLPDTLFVQTDQATVHAINAETGQTLWVRTVGSPTHPTMAVGACNTLVGVLNGTKAYLLDRSNGRILWQRRLDGIPAEGPTFTNQYFFVPTLSGQILAYPIVREQFEDTLAPPTLSSDSSAKQPGQSASPTDAQTAATPVVKEETPFTLDQGFVDPLVCVSFGRVTSQPVFLLEDKRSQYLAWATTRGLFVGYVDLQKRKEFAVGYQFASERNDLTSPTYLPPAAGDTNSGGTVFFASATGGIHAVTAIDGTELWQYALEQSIAEPAVPIGDRLYVTTRLNVCHCLDAKTGVLRWSTSGISRFIAAGSGRLYLADPDGRIRILDAATGEVIDGLGTAESPIQFRNLWTDRIYLATPTGLVQCLRETAQTAPLRHQKPQLPPVEAAGGEDFVPAEKPAAKAEPDDETQPEPAGADPFK